MSNYSLRMYRTGGMWGFRVKTPNVYAQSGGESLLWREAAWNALCTLLGKWRWKIPWDRLCKPDFDRVPLEYDDWSIHLECGHVITRTYLHDPLRPLPTDVEWDEPHAYCPTHGFERVWFTAGVLDPDPWYPGSAGMREFGWRRPMTDHKNDEAAA